MRSRSNLNLQMLKLFGKLKVIEKNSDLELSKIIIIIKLLQEMLLNS